MLVAKSGYDTGILPSPPIYIPAKARAYMPRRKAGKGDQMKINIEELSYDEIKDVVDRLRAMKIESKFSRLGSSIILQTEQGPMVIARNEAVELFGIPAVF